MPHRLTTPVYTYLRVHVLYIYECQENGFEELIRGNTSSHYDLIAQSK